MWTLYNDCEIKEDLSWVDLVSYAVDTKCIPTVIIFEDIKVYSQNKKW
jgi:hypothetical protein